MERVLAAPVIPDAAAWLGALADLGVPAAYWQAEWARCGVHVEVDTEETSIFGMVGRRVSWQVKDGVLPPAVADWAPLLRGETAGGWQRMAAVLLQAREAGAVLTADEWLAASGVALGLAYLDVTTVAVGSVGTGVAELVARALVTTTAVPTPVPERTGYGIGDEGAAEVTLGYAQPTAWTHERPYVFGDTARAREAIGNR